MGVLISVDDFGTGYSSMSYLRRLPIDKLKIDRSFISEITARADDASIVQAIVSLAHSLRLKVVADFLKGVETAAQLEFLSDPRLRPISGLFPGPRRPAGGRPHFSRPLPVRLAAGGSRSRPTLVAGEAPGQAVRDLRSS
jgi:EAL domain-containing protein (putative c-di-GMP-specific phosphodiesterase class I)